jgi:6-phosphogluconate dehydrogenase (decarboxylating)
MQLGFIGLGRMGGNMARRLVAGGHQVVVWDRSAGPVKRYDFDLAAIAEVWRRGSVVSSWLLDLAALRAQFGGHVESPR